ncbi:MAG: hypothetical protein JWM33_2948 [Caulobacteraceae bacterium]|nr:hypothetical protein [Caulobacteraceae bacterium]
MIFDVRLIRPLLLAIVPLALMAQPATPATVEDVFGGPGEFKTTNEATAKGRLTAQLDAMSLPRADVTLTATVGIRGVSSNTISFYHRSGGWVATRVQEQLQSGSYLRRPDLWATSGTCGAIQTQLDELDKLSLPTRLSTSLFKAQDEELDAARKAGHLVIAFNEGTRFRLEAPSDKGGRLQWSDPGEAGVAWIEATIIALKPCWTDKPPA